MELYRDDYMSLPEAVKENMHNINELFELYGTSNFNKDDILVSSTLWELEGDRYVYKVNGDSYKDKMLFFVLPDVASRAGIDNFSKIYYSRSFDGYIELYATVVPENVNICIYYMSEQEE